MCYTFFMIYKYFAKLYTACVTWGKLIMMNEDKNQKLVEDVENIDACSQEEIKENDTDKCQAEISLWKDQCKRISAEFENFKKRSERDQLRWVELSKEKMLKELLSIVDDFDRALKQEKSDKSGLELMYASFLKFLNKNGVVVMQNYETFDPEFHEAVMQIESPDHTAGQIVDVFAQGFMIQDRVLRPAQVSVAK